MSYTPLTILSPLQKECNTYIFGVKLVRIDLGSIYNHECPPLYDNLTGITYSRTENMDINIYTLHREG